MRLLLVILMVLCSVPVFAQVWNGSQGNSDWYTGLNWDGGAVPAAGSGDPGFTTADDGGTINLTNSVAADKFSTQSGSKTFNIYADKELYIARGRMYNGTSTYNGPGRMRGDFFCYGLGGLSQSTFNGVVCTNLTFNSGHTANEAGTVTNVLNACNFVSYVAGGVVDVGAGGGAAVYRVGKMEFNSCTGTVGSATSVLTIGEGGPTSSGWLFCDSPNLTQQYSIANMIGLNGVYAKYEQDAGTFIATTLNLASTSTNVAAQAILDINGGTFSNTTTFVVGSVATVSVLQSGGDLYLDDAYGDPTTNSWYTVDLPGGTAVSELNGTTYHVYILPPEPPPSGTTRSGNILPELNAIKEENALQP